MALPVKKLAPVVSSFPRSNRHSASFALNIIRSNNLERPAPCDARYSGFADAGDNYGVDTDSVAASAGFKWSR